LTGREVEICVGRRELVAGSVTYFDFVGENIACPRRSLHSNPKKVQYHARTKGSSMPFDIGFLSLQL